MIKYNYATVIDVLRILGFTIAFCKFWFENDTLIQVRYRHLLGIWYVVIVYMLFSSFFDFNIWMHSSDPPFFKGVGSKFWLPPLEGEIKKLKKGVEVWSSLKRGRGLALFQFNYFKVYHFYI